ncbi:MAG TPA: hypothetical protein VFZ64_09765 [Nocardioidaceae bacterium]
MRDGSGLPFDLGVVFFGLLLVVGLVLVGVVVVRLLVAGVAERASKPEPDADRAEGSP